MTKAEIADWLESKKSTKILINVGHAPVEIQLLTVQDSELMEFISSILDAVEPEGYEPGPLGLLNRYKGYNEAITQYRNNRERMGL